MKEILILCTGIILTLVIGGIAKLLTTFFKRHVTIQSPEYKKIQEMIPTLNAIVDLIGPIATGVIAILEAESGVRNGNLKIALDSMRIEKKKYDIFCVDSTKINPKEMGVT